MSRQPIDELLQQTEALGSEESFLAEYPFPWLVQEATQGPAPGMVTGAGERGTQRLDKGQAAAPIGDGFAMAGGQVWVHPVCPRDPERNQGAVTLGRAASCDVVVEDGSISTHHASFTLDIDAAGVKTFFVTDAGSSNGTFVDGARIGADPVALEDQVSLRFGPAVKFQFFTAPGFYEFLSFYRRIRT